MKIQRSYVRKTLRLSIPLRTATTVWRERTVFVIRYEEADFVGWGEAAPLEGWGSESEAECVAQLTRWVGDGTLPTAPSAAFGVDVAMFDRLARRAEQPLWQFLGGTRGSVTCHYTLGAVSKEETFEHLCAAREAGFRTAKLKVGAASLQSDIDRVNEVSRSFPMMKLRLDANGSWSLGEAQWFVEATGSANIDYVEQPLRVGDVAGLVALRGLGVPVAADEGANSRSLRTSLIDAGAVDVVVLKPSTLGTVSELREEVSRMSAEGIRIVFSSAIESAIGRNAVAHIVAGLGATEPAGLNTGKWIADDLAPWEVRAAKVMLEGPGLGTVLADAAEQIHGS